MIHSSPYSNSSLPPVIRDWSARGPSRSDTLAQYPPLKYINRDDIVPPKNYFAGERKPQVLQNLRTSYGALIS